MPNLSILWCREKDSQGWAKPRSHSVLASGRSGESVEGEGKFFLQEEIVWQLQKTQAMQNYSVSFEGKGADLVLSQNSLPWLPRVTEIPDAQKNIWTWCGF